MRSRVTPGVSSTTAWRRPMMRLTRVDLPTFGRPTTATTGTGPVNASSAGTASKLTAHHRKATGPQDEQEYGWMTGRGSRDTAAGTVQHGAQAGHDLVDAELGG